MTNHKRLLRQAKSLLRRIAKLQAWAAAPQKESPCVRMAKAIVGAK